MKRKKMDYGIVFLLFIGLLCGSIYSSSRENSAQAATTGSSVCVADSRSVEDNNYDDCDDGLDDDDDSYDDDYDDSYDDDYDDDYDDNYDDDYNDDSYSEKNVIKMNYCNVEVKKGKKLQLKAYYNNYFGKKGTISFKTSNSSIATVTSKGMVTGKKKGKAVITAFDDVGATVAKCSVQVGTKTQVILKGIKGDNSTLQAALDQAASDEKMHYLIKVKKGTYKLVCWLTVYSNTTLDIRGVTFKNMSPQRYMLTFGNSYKSNNGKGGYKDSENIQVLGGTFDAGKSADTANICKFAHAQNITIKGTTFKYLPKKKVKKNSHCIEFAGGKNIKIQNCKFYNNNNCVINNEAIQMESLYNEAKLVASTPALGKRDGTQCKNVTISGCYFKGFTYGCGSNHLSKRDHFQSIRFLNNRFVNVKKYGICIYGYRKVTIKGNKQNGGKVKVLRLGR